jgi:hypothetical protein
MADNHEVAGPPSATHNNQDLLLWSLYLLGGAERWVDVEDLYLRAFDLAPSRLAWRTRNDLPDYKKCAKALQALEDPRRSEHRGLVDKQGQYLRKLTMAGQAWCEQHRERLDALYGGQSVVPSAARQEDAQRLRAVTQSSLFSNWAASGRLAATRWDLADLFRCVGDAPLSTWNARFDEVVQAARRNGKDDVEEFVEAARTQVHEELR